MAENAAQSIKELQERLVSADKTLGEMIQRLGKYESWMSSIFSDMAQNAKVSIDEIADYITKKMRRENLKQSESLMKDILGIEDAKKEVEKVPTMFERVIAQINQRAQQSGENFAKKLVNAESAKSEAEEFARTFLRSFQRAQQQIQQTKGNVVTAFSDVPQSLQPWINTVFKYMDTSRGHQALVNNPITRYAEALKQLQELERRYEGTDNALGRSYKNALIKVREYIEAVQKVKQLEEQAAQSQQKYASNVSAIEGVTRRYNDNEQALAKIQQRWEELNVKKQAGLINEKDFKTQTQQILDEYDRLIAKRKEFEIGDLGQMSSKRESEREKEEERLAQLRKSNTQARLDDEMRAEKMIKQARAERAKKEAEADANMKKAVSQQVTNYKQLSALLKQYNSLKQVKGRTQEEEAALERTRQKIKEIIAEMRKLDSEQKGSLGKARDITEYDRILAKDREITNEKKKQNDLTKQQKANLNSLLPTLQRLASAFGVAFSVRGLAQFGKKLIETRGEFERQQVALRQIIQNKQLADEIWDKTMQAALQSPFTAMQLTTYTKQLAAYRIETNKLFDTTKRLADISAGLGVDMGRLILAYGQVKAANYLRASEIRQFTEAGVNILGELSKHLSATRGQFISTAQVMEMVTKRMVRFEDVEQVFKNLTEQGGIFYDMQRVQSQTVRGQIQKLHDAYDQMLNNIGKANQGVLKDMVSVLNNIVKNWREWKTVLDLIAWPAIISMLAKFSKGLFISATAAKLARTNVVGLEKAGTKLQLTLKKLLTTIKTNPWILIATAIAAATVAAINHSKAVRAVNDEYDDLSRRTIETQSNLKDIESTIKKNNDILSDPKNTEAHNAAQKENAELIAKLKEEYPQLAAAMSINEKGIIALGDAMERYNNELELNIRLAELSKASFFNESLKTDIGDYEKGVQSQQDIFNEYKQKAEDYLLTYKNALYEAEEEQKKFYEQNGFYDPNLKQKIDDYYEIVYALTSLLNAKNVEDFNEAIKNLPALDKLVKAAPSGWSYGSAVYYREFEPINKPIEGVGELKKELEQNMSAYEKYLVKMAKLNKDFKWDEKDWALPDTAFIKKYNKQIQDMLFTIDPKTQEVVIGQLGKDLSHVFIAASEQAQTEAGKKGIMKIMLDILKMRDNLELKVDYSKDGGGSTEDPFPKGTKTRKSASKLISLIKEMRSEYDKLSKSAYGYAKSQDKVRQSYQDSVREILGEAGVGIDYDFTTNEGMIAALEKVKSFVQGSSKYAKDAWKDVQKYIDQLETEIEINAQVKIKEDFGRQIEKMFSDYELSLNFESMGIPEDLAKDLFGIDTSSLDEISLYLQRFATEHAEDWNEDINKIYADALKKISDKEQEQYKKDVSDLFKRVKSSAAEMKVVIEQACEDINFAQNLFDPNYVDQATKDIKAKIKQNLEEINRLTPSEGKAEGVAAQQIARLEAENKILENRVKRLTQMYGNISAEQYTDLVRSTIEWENERTQKISMEQLKKMPEYLEAMGRTAGWSNVKLREMLEYLKNLISVSGSDMSLEDYKTVVNQIDKIQEQIKSNDYPFGREGFAKVAQMLEEQTEADEQMKQLEEERNRLQEESKRLNEELVGLQERLNALKAGNHEENKDEIREVEDQIEENLRNQNQNANQQRKVAAGIQTITKGNMQTMVIIDAIIHAVNDTVQDLYKSLEKIEIILQDYSIDTEHGSWAKWAKGMETFAKASQDATNGWEAFKKGDVAGIMLEVVNGIVDIWHGINEIVNQKQVDTIYFNEEKIEDLKRAYERLEKQISKTWDTVSYMQNYTEMTDNLYKQIEALNQQLAAEEAKKNTDKEAVKDYQDKIQDAEDELENLKQAQIEVFGGIGEEGYRDAAQGFVDAWKSAFLETGDGLQGLQDHFDEFLNEWFVKQATMRVAGKMLEPLFRDIDNAVDKYGDGGTSVMMSELAKVRERFGIIAPELSDALEELTSLWGLGGEGSLSGLAAGIQGMTEEQANVLEAYWNSVRGYTANIDMNVSRIAQILGAGGDNTNPMLAQMTLVAQNTNSINTLLQSVTKSGHSQGGYGIKVFAN